MIFHQVYQSSLLNEPIAIVNYQLFNFIAVKYLEEIGFTDPTERQIEQMESIIEQQYTRLFGG